MDVVEWITLATALAMCVGMMCAVAWLYNGYRDRTWIEDKGKRVRRFTWLIRGIGCFEISVGLHLLAQEGWPNAIPLLLLGCIMLAFGGRWVRFTNG